MYYKESVHVNAVGGEALIDSASLLRLQNFVVSFLPEEATGAKSVTRK